MCLPKTHWVHSFISNVGLGLTAFACMDRGRSGLGPVLMMGNMVTETQLLPLSYIKDA